MQRWSPEIIRYLYTAADHSRYYQDLARQLGAFLRPEDRVCDAGCGLGLLSRALLPYCAHVTASAAARPWWCGGISGGTSSAPVSGWRGTLRPTWSGSFSAGA